MKKGSEKTKLEKISEVIAIIAFCAWLAFEFIYEKGMGAWADIASRIAIIVICVFELISNWNDKRVISYIAIGGIICLIGTFVIEFMIFA